MEYEIKRTSDWRGEQQPCSAAYKKGEPDEYGTQDWAINICSLKDIDDICRETDCEIIYDAKYQRVEIYDDYRE